MNITDIDFDKAFAGTILTRKERREIVDGVRKMRKTWEREKNKVQRDLRKIRYDLQRLYPDPKMLRALDKLVDLDTAWVGDPDDLREPLAALLLKCFACGVFKEETSAVVKILVG